MQLNCLFNVRKQILKRITLCVDAVTYTGRTPHTVFVSKHLNLY